MTRIFCDMCGHEITQSNRCEGGRNSSDRLGTTLKRRGHELHIEIITGTSSGKWNDGHFCKYCVLDAIYKLDDRRKTK